MRTGRRTFLKTVTAGGAATRGKLRGAPLLREISVYPRVYTGAQLGMLAFPLGGIGTGTISLGGRGQLRDWEIFNKPDKGNRPKYGFAAIWAQSEGETPRAFVLESRLSPPYEGPFGLGSDNVPGLPRLESARFTGEYPLAQIEWTERSLPVKVSLEAFTPFIPLDAEASGLPVAVLRYRARNLRAALTTVSFAFSLDNPVGQVGRTCAYRESELLRGLHFTNPFLSSDDALNGSFAVAALAAERNDYSALRGWPGGTNWPVGPLHFWDRFSTTGELGPEPERSSTTGSLAVRRKLTAGETADFVFLLAWRFPRRTAGRCGWRSSKGDERVNLGNHYCTRFPTAWAAAEFAAAHLSEYEARTKRFATAIRVSTIPPAVREAAMANLSTLATQTSFRTADGVFHGFEGCDDRLGCCFGSCTHVWNYETATAHLFPALARSLRETSFRTSTDAKGHMAFREILPAGKNRFETAAADGQMGQIVHLYLDWRLSGDTEWLRAMWPAAKRALEYAWIQGGWDANRDGVMEGVQHNTYDVEFIGPNPLCGVWYLAALRAAEEMAIGVGDSTFANECHRLFTQGSEWIDRNLFNGEYYVQKIQGIPASQVPSGLMAGMGTRSTESPDFQLGDGCLVDQLAGQYLADVCGLGPLLSQANIRRALESIYRYNYKRNLSRHPSVQRTYALNDEAALIICDYGKGKRPAVPFPYFAEVMTGFEYTAAALMIHHGLVKEGVECIANIRRRYDGERRNPWDEAECGHHYARAMASWSAILALSGWSYDAPQQAIAASPRVNENRFASFWSTASAWGVYEQTLGNSNEWSLRVEEGSLRCRSVKLGWNPGGHARVTMDSRPLESTTQANVIWLAEPTILKSGSSLRISSPKATA